MALINNPTGIGMYQGHLGRLRLSCLYVWNVCLVCMFGTCVATLLFYLDSTAFCHASNAPCGAAGSFDGTDVVKDHGCGPFISCFNALSSLTSVSDEELGYRLC